MRDLLLLLGAQCQQSSRCVDATAIAMAGTHLAVARPVAGDTDISVACRVLQTKDPTLSLTFEQTW
jgi:hypothetical protein